MHGRKKTGVQATEEEKAAVSSKVATYKKLAGKLLTARAAASANPVTALPEQLGVDLLGLQGQLLKINPDFSTLWNHRRELLLAQQVLDSSPETASDSSSSQAQPQPTLSAAVVAPVPFPPQPLAAKALAGELALTASAIQKQPKSYSAWHHRLWCVLGAVPEKVRAANNSTTTTAASTATTITTTTFSSSSSSSAANAEADEGGVGALLAGELALCGQLLDLDQRNFHCWAYRLQIAALARVSPEEELAFTREKITQNFSNSSAFHYRSKVIERLWASAPANGASSSSSSSGGVRLNVNGGQTCIELVAEELAMVGQAAFTEPDDQSAWWYHRFLLAWADKATAVTSTTTTGLSEERQAFLDILRGEAEQLRGLVELEPSCKWPKLTLAATLTRLQAALLQTSTSGVEGDAAGEAGAASEEGAAYLAELADLDPLRKGYYASLLAGPHSHGGAA